jgi:DNA-binding Xre family transcriptional regulator
LARASGYSLREVSRLICGKVTAMPQSIARLQPAINALEREKQETAEILSRARQAIQKNKISLRKLAAQAGIDTANLNKTLMGKRRPSAEILAKLQQILSKLD